MTIALLLFTAWAPELPQGGRETLRLSVAILVCALWPVLLAVWALLGVIVWAVEPFFEDRSS